MSIFDKSLALQQAGNDASLAKELFGMLVKDLPNLKQQMNDACKHNDEQAFWDHTHKIHGGTAYCGVPDLKNACKTLEDAIKAKQKDVIPAALETLNEHIDILLDNATQLLAQDWST